MASVQLTPGGIAILRAKVQPPNAPKPVLQVLSATPLQVSGSERYRLEVSDGTYSSSAMLATQHNELLKKQILKVNSIIRIKESIANEIQTKLIVILLDIEVLENPPNRIGNPVEFGDNAPQQQMANRVVAPVDAPARPQQTYAAPQQTYAAPQQTYAAPQQYVQQPSYSMQQQAPPQQVPQQQQYQGAYKSAPVAPVYPIGGAGGGSRAQPRTIPIKHINPYQNKWTIKARVTSKGDIRTWDKGPNNQGKLFSVDLVDSDGTEIRATFFREAVDMFYPTLEVGGVYTFSEGRVKVANRQFSSIKNEYELNFGKDTQIVNVPDSGDIVRVQLQPIHIRDVATSEPKSSVDVIGVAIDIGEVSSFTSKAGRDLRKMEIELVDQSDASIKLSVWGTKADELSGQIQMAGPNPIVAVKGAQVGDFGGRSLSTLNSSTILVNPPDLPQAGVLRTWFDKGGGRSGVAQLTAGRGSGGEGGSDFRGPASIEDRLNFDSIKQYGLGRNGQQDYCDVKGHLLFVRKDNLYYPACCTEKCNKKVIKNPSQDGWFCEKCNLTFDHPLYRYIANVQIVDPTGSHWCTAFNETGNALFGGCTAQELERLSREDDVQFTQVVDKSQFQEGIFRLKVKEEMYQDQPRLRLTIMNFRPIDYVQESKELLKGIAALQQR